jgi:hypothetical protein
LVSRIKVLRKLRNYVSHYLLVTANQAGNTALKVLDGIVAVIFSNLGKNTAWFPSLSSVAPRNGLYGT